MYPGLHNRVAVVTGGARGIGSAIAVRLAENGCSVVIGYRKRDEEARQTVEKVRSLGVSCEMVKGDISEGGTITHLFEAASSLGKPEILVNCAGLGIAAPISSVTDDLWDKQVNVNLKAPFMCSKEFINRLKDSNWGRIINLSSIAGIHGIPYLSVYSITKAGLIVMTKSLASEAPSGVTVNSIAPGLVRTRMGESLLSFLNLKEDEWAKNNTKTGRLVMPEEVAELTAFLCSDYGASLTGQTFVIDGGQEVVLNRKGYFE
jgi:3-oxoacyl-[acyl-carrier protein] reductase